MGNFQIFILVLLASVCTCLKLPSSFKKCNRDKEDFNLCLTKAVEDAVRQLTNPIKEIGLPRLDPFVIPVLTFDAGTGAVAFQQNFQNFKVYGFSKGNFSKVDMNFKNKTMVMEAIFPEIKLVYDYDFNGKILVLPIQGKGSGTGIMSQVKGSLTIVLEEYEKKGKTHFKVVSLKVSVEPETIKVELQNLFGGDKTLGDNLNKVLNDNAKDLYAEVRTGYEDTFAQIFSAMFNKLLTKVPISELFDAE